MIEKLQWWPNPLRGIKEPPTPDRLMDKINEIIDAVNQLAINQMPPDLQSAYYAQHPLDIPCGVKPGPCTVPIDGVCGH